MARPCQRSRSRKGCENSLLIKFSRLAGTKIRFWFQFHFGLFYTMIRRRSISGALFFIVVFGLIARQPAFGQSGLAGNQYWEKPLETEESTEGTEPGFFPAAAMVWIRIYQKGISSQDLPSCVFHPSCSRFAFGCIERYGVLKGVLLAADRLLRCNPFVRKHYEFDGEKYVDPVERYDFVRPSQQHQKHTGPS